MKNICVIGTGYVGLVNGTCFADLGNNVVTVDIDEKKIQDLQNGVMPIYEPGLAEIVVRSVNAGRLRFTTSYEDGLKDAEFVFICAGDMPFINPELIRLLIAQMNRGHDAVVPSHNDQREPLCALYNQKAKTAIGKAIDDGDLSVHGVLDRLSVLAVDEKRG